MLTTLLFLAAAQLAVIVGCFLFVWQGGRETRRTMRAQYPGRDFSPVWTNRDGRRWKYCLTSGRIVQA
jgi:hypothetical protein